MPFFSTPLFSMRLRNTLFISGLLLGASRYAAAQQLPIYANGQSLITDKWQSGGTLDTTMTITYDGNEALRFSYNYTTNWAGFGLSLNAWNAQPAHDFSGYTHLAVAYKGLSAGNNLSVTLTDSTGNNSTYYVVGNPQAAYTVVNVPLSLTQFGSAVNFHKITQISFGVGNQQAASGTVYIDAIKLLTQTNTASATAWSRNNTLGKGINLSNWLEAYWNDPSDPDPTVYTRTDIDLMAQIGINTVRMPVIFDYLSDTINAPYGIYPFLPAFARIDSVIAWTQQNGMNLLIDNHHGIQPTDANYLQETARACGLWKSIVQQYATLNPNKVLFELRNEPQDITAEHLHYYEQSIIDTIRRYDMQHSIVASANGWGGAASLYYSQPYSDPADNIIYTFHNYDPYTFTHQGFPWSGLPTGRVFPQAGDVAALTQTFRRAKAWSAAFNKPVFLGEFGCSRYADSISRCNWVSAVGHLCDSLALPWMYWDYKGDFRLLSRNELVPSAVNPCFAQALHLNGAVVATANTPITAGSFAMRIAPNPAVAAITLYTTGQPSALPLTAQLTNLAGQTLRHIALTSAAQPINIDDLPAGMYFITVFAENKPLATQKFAVGF